MLEGRLLSTLEGLIFALFIGAVFFLISTLVRVAFKKSIGSPRYYTIAMVCGFLLHRVLVSVLPAEPPAGIGHPGDPSPSSAQVGLDAPFIPPAEDDLESFPAQLDLATARLRPEERAELSDTISFLVFSFGSHLAEQDPSRFDDAGDLDLAAGSLVRLYRYARKRGDLMTLRSYIDLAEDMKRQRPDWWAEFQAQDLEHSSPTP